MTSGCDAPAGQSHTRTRQDISRPAKRCHALRRWYPCACKVSSEHRAPDRRATMSLASWSDVDAILVSSRDCLWQLASSSRVDVTDRRTEYPNDRTHEGWCTHSLTTTSKTHTARTTTCQDCRSLACLEVHSRSVCELRVRPVACACGTFPNTVVIAMTSIVGSRNAIRMAIASSQPAHEHTHEASGKTEQGMSRPRAGAPRTASIRSGVRMSCAVAHGVRTGICVDDDFLLRSIPSSGGHGAGGRSAAGWNCDRRK
jgi:hypothetical protein